MPRLFFLFRNILSNKRIDDDLDEEVRAYLDHLVAEKVARGMKQDEAERAARIELGGVEQVKETVRAVRMGAMLDTISRDIRQAIRGFAKSPGFTLVAALTLALGVGANAAIFSLINAVLITGLPYANPQQLVMIAQQIPQEDRVAFSPREFLDFAPYARSLDSFSAAAGNGFTVSRHDSEPRATFGQLVTMNMFRTLGVDARLGRTFSDEEGVPGHDHVVVLSDALWRGYFSSDPQVIGDLVTLNNEVYRVVGVMPAGFEYPDSKYELWVPAALHGGFFQKFSEAHFLRVVARLRAGATVAGLQQDLSRFNEHLARQDANAKRRVYAVDLQTAVTGDVRKPLLLLMSAVGLLLLIACANVANLVLSRATFRAREFAVRAAIGATRSRLIAQVMTESLLLGLIGGVAGLLGGTWAVDLLVRLNPGNIPLIHQAHLDSRVVLFVLAVSVIASCLFGLGPAFSTSTSNLIDFIRRSGRGTVGGAGRRVRRGLVFAQVALATMLMIGAGVMIRSLIALEGVPSGIRPEGVLTAGVVMTEQRYPDARQMLAFYGRVLDEARRMPGVQEAAIATHLPFTGQGWGNRFDVEGMPPAPGEQHVAQVRPISPEYFSTLGIPLEHGRDFAANDNSTSLPVAIINSTLAKRFWPDGDALGKRIDMDGSWRTIVGIARDVKPGRLDVPAGPEIYFPYEQFSPDMMKFVGRAMTIVVRSSSGDALALVPGLRRAVQNADKAMALRDVRTMNDLIGGTVAQPRFRAILLGIFSALALTVAAVGIYGVISYSVTQRLQEFGVRIAIGASTRDILALVLRDGATVALAGVAAGVVGSLALGRTLTTLLFEVKPTDPSTIASVCTLLTIVAVVASFVPALRATRLDPTTSLRGE